MSSSASTRRLLHPLLFILISLASFFIACWLDRPALQFSLVFADMEGSDFYELLRVAGYSPFWMLIALAMFLDDLHRRWRRGQLQLATPLAAPWDRGLMLLLAVALSGLMSEFFKMTLRRLRPFGDGYLYDFRPFDIDTFSSSGLGLPSGHAAVAFGAAFMLCKLHREGSLLWILIACGCAFTRMLTFSHYFSDVVMSAICAYAAVEFFWHLHQRIQFKKGLPTADVRL